MFDQTDVKNKFADLIEFDNLLIKESPKVIISVNDFYNLFKNAKSLNYNDLMLINGNKKGYKSFFDKCKEKGILD